MPPMGGPMWGGPMGGPMGGPPMGGPHGGFSRGEGTSEFNPINLMNPYSRSALMPPTRGHVSAKGAGLVTKLAIFSANFRMDKDYLVKRQGFLKGYISTFRIHTSGKLRYNSLNKSISYIDKDIEALRKNAGNSAEEQSKLRSNVGALLLKKMDVAKSYYDYLYDVGFINKQDYDYSMGEFASKINVKYIGRFPEVQKKAEEPEKGRKK